MVTEAIVAAVIAGSSVCSDHFENVSRFNPTNLSDYQQCIHISHENDSGIVGKYMWIRVGYDFTYIPLKQLQTAGTRDARKAIVHDAVSNTIIARLEAEHQMQVQNVLDEVIPDLQAIINQYNIDYNLGTIKTLEEFATALIKFIDATGLKMDELNATITTQANEIARLQKLVDSIENNEQFAVAAQIKAEFQSQLDALEAENETLIATTARLQNLVNQHSAELASLVSEHDAEIKNLETMITMHDAAIQAKDDEIATLREDLKIARNEAEDALSDLGDAEDALIDEQQEHQRTREALANAQTRLDNMPAVDNTELQAEVNRLRIQFETDQARIENLVANVQHYATRWRAAEDRLSALAAQLEASQTEAMQFETQNVSLRGDLARERENLRLARVALATEQARVDSYTVWVAGTRYTINADQTISFRYDIDAAVTSSLYTGDRNRNILDNDILNANPNAANFNSGGHGYRATIEGTRYVIRERLGQGGIVINEGNYDTFIRAVLDRAYSDGYLDGYDEGYAEGYDQGFRDGFAAGQLTQ